MPVDAAATPPAPTTSQGTSAGGAGQQQAGGGAAGDKSGAGEQTSTAGQTSNTTAGGAGTTGDAKGSGDGASTVPAAPIPLELKLPAGVKADDPTIGEFKKLATEAKLDGKAAQAIYDLHHRVNAAAAEAAQKAQDAVFEQERAGWIATLKADKEIGGAAYETNKQIALKPFVKFPAGAEAKKLLDESGFGDHPAFVRLFLQIGKAMGEDSIAGTGASGVKTPGNDDQTFLRSMYDHPASQAMFNKG